MILKQAAGYRNGDDVPAACSRDRHAAEELSTYAEARDGAARRRR